MYRTIPKCTRWLYVRAGGRNGSPSAHRDNNNSLLRYVTGLAAANHPRPCRCRVVCSPHRSMRAACPISITPMRRLPSPCARATVTSTAQIMPPPLRQVHADSGRRQGRAPGAHYPNASAARHRLLFAASRTQERCRGVKQAGSRWQQNSERGISDRWLAAVSETIHVG